MSTMTMSAPSNVNQHMPSSLNRSSKIPAFFQDRKNATKFALRGVLGSGAHATVYKAADLDRGCNVAVKQIKPRSASRPAAPGTSKPLNEFMVGKHLKHPNLTKTREFMEFGRDAYIVFDLAEDGDLFDRLDPKGPGLTESQARTWLAELCSGLEYMHAKKVVHRDIKPENILIHRGHVQVCDFGLAAQEGARCRGRAPGTGAYMAPEVIAAEAAGRDRIVDPAQDVWAVGIVVYAILFADLPWELASVRDPEFADFVAQGGVNSRVHPFSLLSREMRTMLGRLLAVDPRKRCSMTEALKFFRARHAWFADQQTSLDATTTTAVISAPSSEGTGNTDDSFYTAVSSLSLSQEAQAAQLAGAGSCSSLDSVLTAECSSPEPADF